MTPSEIAIVGITLARNEDRFLPRALKNASGFCDSFFLFDHQSTDRSPQILSDFAAEHPAAEYHCIDHPRDSHRVLEPLAGQSVWVFGVDGDEIYDPLALEVLRHRLKAGEFSDSWMLMGHCLHVDRLEESSATGFSAPPSRSITKLYNFAAIDSWQGVPAERLHGGFPAFRNGFSPDKKRLLHVEIPWEDSPLRCLHMCFLPRSSNDTANDTPRLNIDEKFNGPPAFIRLLRRIRLLPVGPNWKNERYRRGPRTTVDTAPFMAGKNIA
jgi:hypothetical protein